MQTEISKEMILKDSAGNFRIPKTADTIAICPEMIIDNKSPYMDGNGTIRFPEIPKKQL